MFTHKSLNNTLLNFINVNKMINNHHIDKNTPLCTTLSQRNHRNTDRSHQLALNAVLGQLGDPVHLTHAHIHICKPYDYLCI